KFIGVDQSPICIDTSGNLDTTFGCKGDPKTLLPNYTSLYFQEDQPGYLAGMVAASITKTKHIAAVGGINVVPPVVRYIQGFQLGAQAIDPSVKVDVAYVSTSDFTKAFNDPVAGKEAMISAALQAKLTAALNGMKNGSVTTCPAKCGQP